MLVKVRIESSEGVYEAPVLVSVTLQDSFQDIVNKVIAKQLVDSFENKELFLANLAGYAPERQFMPNEKASDLDLKTGSTLLITNVKSASSQVKTNGQLGSDSAAQQIVVSQALETPVQQHPPPQKTIEISQPTDTYQDQSPMADTPLRASTKYESPVECYSPSSSFDAQDNQLFFRDDGDLSFDRGLSHVTEADDGIASASEDPSHFGGVEPSSSKTTRGNNDHSGKATNSGTGEAIVSRSSSRDDINANTERTAAPQSPGTRGESQKPNRQLPTDNTQHTISAGRQDAVRMETRSTNNSNEPPSPPGHGAHQGAVSSEPNNTTQTTATITANNGIRGPSDPARHRRTSSGRVTVSSPSPLKTAHQNEEDASSDGNTGQNEGGTGYPDELDISNSSNEHSGGTIPTTTPKPEQPHSEHNEKVTSPAHRTTALIKTDSKGNNSAHAPRHSRSISSNLTTTLTIGKASPQPTNTPNLDEQRRREVFINVTNNSSTLSTDPTSPTNPQSATNAQTQSASTTVMTAQTPIPKAYKPPIGIYVNTMIVKELEDRAASLGARDVRSVQGGIPSAGSNNPALQSVFNVLFPGDVSLYLVYYKESRMPELYNVMVDKRSGRVMGKVRHTPPSYVLSLTKGYLMDVTSSENGNSKPGAFGSTSSLSIDIPGTFPMVRVEEESTGRPMLPTKRELRWLIGHSFGVNQDVDGEGTKTDQDMLDCEKGRHFKAFTSAFLAAKRRLINSVVPTLYGSGRVQSSYDETKLVCCSHVLFPLDEHGIRWGIFILDLNGEPNMCPQKGPGKGEIQKTSNSDTNNTMNNTAGLVFKSKRQMRQEIQLHFFRFRLIRLLEMSNRHLSGNKNGGVLTSNSLGNTGNIGINSSTLTTISSLAPLSSDIIVYPPDVLVCYLKPLLATLNKGERNGRWNWGNIGGLKDSRFLNQNIEGPCIALFGPTGPKPEAPLEYSIQYLFNRLLVRAFYRSILSLSILSNNTDTDTMGYSNSAARTSANPGNSNNPLIAQKNQQFVSDAENPSNPFFSILAEESRELVHKCLSVAHPPRLTRGRSDSKIRGSNEPNSCANLAVCRQAIDYVPLSFFKHSVSLGDEKGCKYIELPGALSATNGIFNSYNRFESDVNKRDSASGVVIDEDPCVSMSRLIDGAAESSADAKGGSRGSAVHTNGHNSADTSTKVSQHSRRTSEGTASSIATAKEVFACISDICDAVCCAATRRRILIKTKTPNIGGAESQDKGVRQQNTSVGGGQIRDDGPRSVLRHQQGQQRTSQLDSLNTDIQQSPKIDQKRGTSVKFKVAQPSPFMSSISLLAARFGELVPIMSTMSASLSYLSGTGAVSSGGSESVDSCYQLPNTGVKEEQRKRRGQSADNIVRYFEEVKKEKVQRLQTQQSLLEREQVRLRKLEKLQRRIQTEETENENSFSSCVSSNYTPTQSYTSTRTCNNRRQCNVPPPSDGREALVFQAMTRPNDTTRPTRSKSLLSGRSRLSQDNTIRKQYQQAATLQRQQQWEHRSGDKAGGRQDLSLSAAAPRDMPKRKNNHSSLSPILPHEGTVRHPPRVTIAPAAVLSLKNRCCIALAHNNSSAKVLIDATTIAEALSNVKTLCTQAGTTPAGCVVSIRDLNYQQSLQVLSDTLNTLTTHGPHPDISLLIETIDSGLQTIPTSIPPSPSVSFSTSVSMSTCAQYLRNDDNHDSHTQQRTHIKVRQLRELLGVSRVLGFVDLSFALLEVGVRDLFMPDALHVVAASDALGYRSCPLLDFVLALQRAQQHTTNVRVALWARCVSEYSRLLSSSIPQPSRQLLTPSAIKGIRSFSLSCDYRSLLVDISQALAQSSISPGAAQDNQRSTATQHQASKPNTNDLEAIRLLKSVALNSKTAGGK